MTQGIDPTLIPEVSQSLLWRTLDDGAVVITPEEGQVRVFNEAGAVIWNLIDGRRTIGEIAQDLGHHFGLAAAQAEADVTQFVLALRQRDLISLKSST